MPTICIQCSMKAMLAGEKYEPTEETIEEHMRRCHPDLAATKKEREELERRLVE